MAALIGRFLILIALIAIETAPSVGTSTKADDRPRQLGGSIELSGNVTSGERTGSDVQVLPAQAETLINYLFAAAAAIDARDLRFFRQYEKSESGACEGGASAQSTGTAAHVRTQNLGFRRSSL